MAANILIVKKIAPATEDQARRKAEFDSSMVMIRHHVRFTTEREAAEYFIRAMARECDTLARRFGIARD